MRGNPSMRGCMKNVQIAPVAVFDSILHFIRNIGGIPVF
jgi:hypothetical protein